MVRMVYTWYSVVRIVNGTKSPDTRRNVVRFFSAECPWMVTDGRQPSENKQCKQEANAWLRWQKYHRMQWRPLFTKMAEQIMIVILLGIAHPHRSHTIASAPPTPAKTRQWTRSGVVQSCLVALLFMIVTWRDVTVITLLTSHRHCQVVSSHNLT